MTKPPADKPPKKPERSAREARLAKALRDNLRRRKGAPAPKQKPEFSMLETAKLAPKPYWLLRELTLKDRETGTERTVHIEISQPYQIDEDQWACVLRMPGWHTELYEEHGLAMIGIDGGQALQHALHIADTEVGIAARTCDVTWLGGVPYDMRLLWAPGEG